MTKQVVYDGESQSYNQVQRPNVQKAGGAIFCQEYNSSFMEGSPFGPYNGRGESIGGKKKKKKS